MQFKQHVSKGSMAALLKMREMHLVQWFELNINIVLKIYTPMALGTSKH